MKNKLKSIRSSSKSAAASQPKTSIRKANAPRRRQPAGTIRCVWIFPDGSEWAHVDFERELFSIIERAAAKWGMTLQQLFDNAIRNYIKLLKSRRAA